MRPFTLNLLLAAALLHIAGAQSSSADLSSLPTCASTCLLSAIEASSCPITNQTCICTNAPLQKDVTACVSANCTVKQALFTKNVTQTICGAPIRDRSTTYNITSITLASISAFFILLRLGFKQFIARVGLGLDDWFILLTILSGIPSTVIVSQGTIPSGLGKDIWTLKPEQITSFGRYFYVMAILYFFQVMLLKMSLLLFYLRIFPEQSVRRVLWGTVAFNALFGIIFVVVSIFQCNPISYFWTKWDGEHVGTCLSINGIGWANAIISIALDLWMLAIPLSQIRDLHLHWKKKIGVSIMFATGTFVTVVSILRLQSLVLLAKTDNLTWEDYDVSNWSSIEINVGIICACMPTLRLILVRVFPSLGSSQTGGPYYNASASKSGIKSHGRSHTRSVVESGTSEHSTGGILYKKEYTVHYGDGDESSLVNSRDIELQNVGAHGNISRVST